MLANNRFMFRPNTGMLETSMMRAVPVDRTLDALTELISELYNVEVNPDVVQVYKYGMGSHIGWDTHVVWVVGMGPVGFTDGPLPERCEGK